MRLPVGRLNAKTTAIGGANPAQGAMGDAPGGLQQGFSPVTPPVAPRVVTDHGEVKGHVALWRALQGLGDCTAFLRECRLAMRISPLNEVNLRRVYELAQRTNQMNFSGRRYPEAELTEIMTSASFETYVIDCSNRFGEYGIVGFAVVDIREPRFPRPDVQLSNSEQASGTRGPRLPVEAVRVRQDAGLFRKLPQDGKERSVW
jgi:hypothetical protein